MTLGKGALVQMGHPVEASSTLMLQLPLLVLSSLPQLFINMVRPIVLKRVLLLSLSVP